MTQAEQAEKAPRITTCIGVALTLGLPALFVALPSAQQPSIAASLVREGIWWAMGAIILIWALARERLSLPAMGITRPTWRSFAWALPLGLTLMLLIGLCYAVIFPALGIKNDPANLATIASKPIWLIFLLALRAGVTEEWLFRFYPIHRLMALGAGRWISSLMPAAVFVALHAPSWGLAHLIPVTLAAIALTLFYWWRRDYWSSVLGHFLADFIPFSMAALAAAHGAG